MCDHTEQHQEDGHRHHYHIMANAERDREITCLCVQVVGQCVYMSQVINL